MRPRRALPLLLAATLVAAGRAHAQQSIKSSITLSSLTLTFPTPTDVDYDNGSVAASNSLTVTFDSKKNAGNQPIADRTSTISVRATGATMGGTKPISDLQWRRSDLAAWNGLTLSDVTIESRGFRYNGINDPWAATVFFRTLLSWTATPPATYSATIVFTLTVTTP